MGALFLVGLLVGLAMVWGGMRLDDSLGQPQGWKEILGHVIAWCLVWGGLITTMLIAFLMWLLS